jgi:Hermes transposase DNA-binding domain
VLSYDSSKGGTSHLRRHADSCNAGASVNSPSIANFFKPSGVSNAAKQQIIEKCVHFVCRDIRPFQTVAGEGFQALADALIMIGVKYGQVAASEILHNPTTISRNIETKYAEIKENVVIPELLKYVNVYGGNITTDMWTEQFTQTSYITLTVHYVNDDWELVCRTLSTSEFDHDLRHTGVNIRKTIGAILDSFEIDSTQQQGSFCY